jgi:hypothetical protein
MCPLLEIEGLLIPMSRGGGGSMNNGTGEACERDGGGYVDEEACDRCEGKVGGGGGGGSVNEEAHGAYRGGGGR